MEISNPLRVAALVDLPRSTHSGGHVKCWERLAQAAAQSNLPLDLTVYFSGAAAAETPGPRTHLKQLPPIFSTSRLKFLPYAPDHSDLARYHPRLAHELTSYDVLHTTDGFFAYARTAERVSRAHKIPLVTSFHTDTPSYARIFTQETIEKIFGGGWLAKQLTYRWKLPLRQQQKMERRLAHHVSQCREAIVTRAEDHVLVENLIGPKRTHHFRLGIDKNIYGPHRRDRALLERAYDIPPGRLVVLFVGRLDVGKNIYTLLEAMEKLSAEGSPLHLIAAGVGPAADDIKKRLGTHVSLPGYVEPDELARLYASANVLALCSEVEIRSMAAVEAMASGLPALVARKSGIVELFDHTPAMQVVDGGMENWIAALREFVSKPEKQKTMHEAALDYSRDHLASWQDVLAEDFLPVWQKAANWPTQRREAA